MPAVTPWNGRKRGARRGPTTTGWRPRDLLGYQEQVEHSIQQFTGLPSIADSSIAKCFANEAAREITGKAMQLMGGYGYSKEFPLEQKLRDAWGWGIAGGAIDIQKINITSALVGRRFNQRAS